MFAALLISAAATRLPRTNAILTEDVERVRDRVTHLIHTQALIAAVLDDGALVALRTASVAMQGKDIPTKGKSISKAIDIVMKNNIELIKGVDRASTTTVSALRTAVLVAQALNNQKLVLDQITALNTTTSDMIQRTSEMLRDNSVAIQEQAASSTLGLDQLQAAFANIYETMDAIDAFRSQALDNMAQTIGVLEGEVAKSQDYLERAKKTDIRLAGGSLDLGDTSSTGR